jgi:RND family efflux transporter MFP subunit
MKSVAGLVATAMLCGWVGFTIGVNRTARLAPRMPARSEVEGPIEGPKTAACQQDYVGVVVGRNSAQLASRSAGRIVALSADVGDTVKRGQQLALLESQLLEADLAAARAGIVEAEARSLRAAHELALATAERRSAEQLGGYVSRQDLLVHQQQEKVAAANLSAARAVLEGKRQVARRSEREARESVVRAPFDGRVSRRYLDVGAVVALGAPILEVTNDSERILRFAVPAKEGRTMSVGSTVTTALDGGGPPTNASIKTVAPAVDLASDTIVAEAEFPDQRRLPAVGTVARVRLECSPGLTPTPSTSASGYLAP